MRGESRGRPKLSVVLLALLVTSGVVVSIVPALGFSQGDFRSPGDPEQLREEDSTSVTRAESRPRPAVSVRVERRSHYRVGFELSLDALSSTSEVVVHVPNATVTGTDGFRRTDRRNAYRWDGHTPVPSIAYEVDIRDRQVPAIRGKEYAASEDWIFAPSPPVTVRWIPDGTREVYDWLPLLRPEGGTVSVATDGSGVVGRRFLYLGPYTEYSRMAGEQRVRLVVAEASTLAESPTEIFGALANASDYPGGTGHDEVIAFVLPDPMREGGRASPPAGEFWVHADSRLDRPNSAWFHEYAHTRQNHQLTPDMEWFGEASASYYAVTAQAEQGKISDQTTFEYLDTDRYDSQVLSKSNTWSDRRVPYVKGAKVLFVLSAKINESAGEQRELGDVISRMNKREDRIDYSTFRQIVVDVGGPELGPWLDEHVTTPASPNLDRYYEPTEGGDNDGVVLVLALGVLILVVGVAVGVIVVILYLVVRGA